MKKIISLVLVLVITTLALSSCEVRSPIFSLFSKERSENVGYYSVKTLYSYDEVMDALSIVRQRYDIDPVYTVRDMGEGYTVLYHFTQGHRWTEYPIDYETYFTTKSGGYFCTFIFLDGVDCLAYNHSTDHNYSRITVYKGDEDYDKIMEYNNSSTACVVFINDVMMKKAVDIEDKSLLSYSKSGATYYITYNDEKIIHLESCVDLDDTFFERFYDSLVTTKVTE